MTLPVNRRDASNIHFAESSVLHSAIRDRPDLEEVRLDGAAVRSERDLLRALAVALRFPDYFGENWDAVDECLTEVDASHPEGLRLCVEGAADLWQDHAEVAGKLVRAWLTATQVWSVQGFSAHLVFLLGS